MSANNDAPNETLKETLKEVFGVDLPISGGFGQSVDDPIILDVDSDGVALEYAIIDYIQQMGMKKYWVEKQEVKFVGERKIDKVSIVLEEDQENYRNYYFDITRFY